MTKNIIFSGILILLGLALYLTLDYYNWLSGKKDRNYPESVDYQLIELKTKKELNSPFSDHFLENIDPQEINSSSIKKLKPIPKDS